MGGPKRHIYLITTTVLIFSFSSAYGRSLTFGQATTQAGLVDGARTEQKARQSLGKKLLDLLQTPDLANRAYGSTNVNSNDGNSFESNSSMHSNVWPYCLNWINPVQCEKWLDPYVPLHGLGAEHSNLEGTIAALWQGLSQDAETNVANAGSNGGQFSVFEVEAKEGRSVVRLNSLVKTGSLALENLKEFRLNQQATQKAEQVGKATADRAIKSLTYDENAKGSDEVMPNMESLRTMASVWTRAYRNRMVSNLGEIRAAKEGVEFELGEDRNCDQFLQIAQNSQQINQQTAPGTVVDVLREPITVAQGLQKRYELCKALTSTSINVVNANTKSGSVEAGDPNEERVDEWKTRVNIALIDHVGMDPNSIQRPGYASLKREDYTQELVNYKEGGREYETYEATNAQQIASYNQALEQAEASLRAVASIAGNQVNIQPGDVTKYKIPEGGVDMVSLNGLTPEMMKELENSPVRNNPIYTQGFGQTTGSAAPVRLENNPSFADFTQYV